MSNQDFLVVGQASLDQRGRQLAENFNHLLANLGVQIGEIVALPLSDSPFARAIRTGAIWDKYSRAFRVWLPSKNDRAIGHAMLALQRAGYATSEHTCEDIGAPGFTQIDGEMP